jgi:hypothetical protein
MQEAQGLKGKRNMTSQFRQHLLVLAISTLSGATALARPTLAVADFIQTMASGVYQSTDGNTKVIVSTRANARGLFIVDGPAVPPQEFNVETMPADGSHHVFVKFDDNAQPPVYSEVVINKKSYKIAGNLTLGLGSHTIVSIDNNNPYLTVSTEPSSQGSQPAVLGFSGLNEVIREKGSVTLLLAANQLDSEVARVIRPYIVGDEELTLNGKSITTATVGTFVKPDNECLNPGFLILSAAQTEQIRATKTQDERLKKIEGFLLENRKSDPLRDYLVLKADKKAAILLNVKEKNIRQLYPLSAKRKLCVIADLS